MEVKPHYIESQLIASSWRWSAQVQPTAPDELVDSILGEEEINRLQDHGDLSVMVPKFNEDEKCLLNKGDSNIKITVSLLRQ